MSKKYHIDINGNPAPCTAGKRSCPRGGDESHGSTVEEVKAKFEQQMKSQVVTSFKKNDSKKLPEFEDISKAIDADENLLGKYSAETFASISDAALKELSIVFSASSRGEYGQIKTESDRSKLFMLEKVAMHTKLASELSTTRQKFGVTVPPGHDTFGAVYDLEGNLLCLAKSTGISPRQYTKIDGTKGSYRESKAAERENRVQYNESKGFRIGLAVAPCKINSNYYKVSGSVPDEELIKKGSVILPTDDKGQSGYDNNSNKGPWLSRSPQRPGASAVEISRGSNLNRDISSDYILNFKEVF